MGFLCSDTIQLFKFKVNLSSNSTKTPYFPRKAIILPSSSLQVCLFSSIPVFFPLLLGLFFSTGKVERRFPPTSTCNSTTVAKMKNRCPVHLSHPFHYLNALNCLLQSSSSICSSSWHCLQNTLSDSGALDLTCLRSSAP